MKYMIKAKFYRLPEKAYVLFYKYCDIAYTIRNSPEYSKDRLYYNSMVSSESVEDALDHLGTIHVFTEQF